MEQSITRILHTKITYELNCDDIEDAVRKVYGFPKSAEIYWGSGQIPSMTIRYTMEEEQ